MFKLLANAWLINRAAKKNSSGLVAATIALNGGWRNALGAMAMAYLLRVLAVALPFSLLLVVGWLNTH